MNVRIKYDAELFASIFYNGEIRSNFYSVEIGMLTNCTDPREQNIAFDRIRYLFSDILDSAMIIQDTHTQEIANFARAGHRLVIVPELPIDQILGIVLYCKLNAICEEKLLITSVCISSRLGEGVTYAIDANDIGEKFDSDGWWNVGDCSTMPKNALLSKSKVVTITRNIPWSESGLDFDTEDREQNNNTVVFGKFETHDH